MITHEKMSPLAWVPFVIGIAGLVVLGSDITEIMQIPDFAGPDRLWFISLSTVVPLFFVILATLLTLLSDTEIRTFYLIPALTIGVLATLGSAYGVAYTARKFGQEDGVWASIIALQISFAILLVGVMTVVVTWKVIQSSRPAMLSEHVEPSGQQA